jgi:hypothetical protein
MRFYCIQNYNFACGSVWVWNLVSDIKGGTQTLGVWEQGAENIWTEERWSDRWLEESAYKELHNLYSLPSIIRMTK